MLKTVFVGFLDPIKSGIDQSLIANLFYLFQMILLDFQSPAGVLFLEMMNAGRQPRQVSRVNRKIQGRAQKDPDHNKANQGQNKAMTKEMGKGDSLFKETGTAADRATASRLEKGRDSQIGWRHRTIGLSA